MIQLNLTQQESLILYGFLQSVLEKVYDSPELELIDRERTTNALESMMSNIATQIDLTTNNN
jgi:hypothetical protein